MLNLRPAQRGSSFGDPFSDLAHISDVIVQRTSVEAHSSLNTGEHYHQGLLITFRKPILGRARGDEHLTLA